jgi:hypothetical protein
MWYRVRSRTRLDAVRNPCCLGGIRDFNAGESRFPHVYRPCRVARLPPEFNGLPTENHSPMTEMSAHFTGSVGIAN